MNINHVNGYTRVLGKCTTDLLNRVAITCGFQVQKKKNERIQSIITGLTLSSSLPDKFQVVGVDIGLKNFAFCKLEVDRTSSKPPIITQWKKFDLHKVYLNSYEPILKSPIEYDRDTILEDNLMDSTRYLSYLSRRVLTDHLFNDPNIPTFAVVEHQRTRSNIMPATLPNVLRNCLLENMLYSSFYTMQSMSPKNSILKNSFITPVYSNSMAHFWIHRYLSELNIDKKILTKDVKSLRIKLAYNWINRAIECNLRKNSLTLSPFRFNSDTTKIINLDQDLAKKTFKQVHYKPKKLQKILNLDDDIITNFKMDDLIDSLLHALACVKRFENQKRLVETLELCMNDIDSSKRLILEFIESSKKDQLELMRDLMEETTQAAMKRSKNATSVSTTTTTTTTNNTTTSSSSSSSSSTLDAMKPTSKMVSVQV